VFQTPNSRPSRASSAAACAWTGFAVAQHEAQRVDVPFVQPPDRQAGAADQAQRGAERDRAVLRDA
jgi:hypothetical protein